MAIAPSLPHDVVVVQAWSAPREARAPRAAADLHALVVAALLVVAVLIAGAELAALALVRGLFRALGELLAAVPGLK